MPVGTNRAFPLTVSIGSDNEGMSYREWLIGMALSGFCAAQRVDLDRRDNAEVAATVLDIVDAIVTAMEAE